MITYDYRIGHHCFDPDDYYAWIDGGEDLAAVKSTAINAMKEANEDYAEIITVMDGRYCASEIIRTHAGDVLHNEQVWMPRYWYTAYGNNADDRYESEDGVHTYREAVELAKVNAKNDDSKTATIVRYEWESVTWGYSIDEDFTEEEVSADDEDDGDGGEWEVYPQ